MATPVSETDGPVTDGRQRRGALRTALILALVALGFYVAIFLVVSWRHP